MTPIMSRADGIRASSHLYGIEGLHLKDVLGVAAVALPGSVTAEDRVIDIETRGELTRGMMVVDVRKNAGRPNASPSPCEEASPIAPWAV